VHLHGKRSCQAGLPQITRDCRRATTVVIARCPGEYNTYRTIPPEKEGLTRAAEYHNIGRTSSPIPDPLPTTAP